MDEKSYLTPSLTNPNPTNLNLNSASNGNGNGNAPPPYRYPNHATNSNSNPTTSNHLASATATPSTSRPSSRPASPPPLPHGSSIPSSPTTRGMPGLGGMGLGMGMGISSHAGSPGTFSINLANGRNSAGGRGPRHYVVNLPIIIQKVLALLLRRWKSLLFILVFGTLAAFGMFGAMWTEWREMTYTRVDPYPRIPTQFSPTADQGQIPVGGNGNANGNGNENPNWLLNSDSKPSTNKPIPNTSFKSKYETCPGPLNKPIPHSPSILYETPSNHPLPLVGSYSQLNLDNSKCLTYKSRYEMYTDEALGIWYRQDVDESEELLRKQREDLWDSDPDNPKPIYNPSDFSKGNNPANGDADANAKYNSGNQKTNAPNFNLTDSLFGPKKPHDMDEGNWERYLRDRMWKANVRSEELGPVSFPDWRALMDNCFEQRLRQRGMADGVEKADWNDPEKLSQTNQDDDLNANAAKNSANVFGANANGNPSGNGNGNSREGKGTTTPESKRTALVMRSYEGYVWREDDILNLRALISELSLNNPSTPYDIRILVEVHGRHLSVFTSEWDRLNVLRSSVPREFWGMVELWTEDELCALYPGLPGKFLNHMFAQSSYRSCLMALQKFYLDHQEYDFIYNWEMDVRYIGNYLDFFEGIEDYARREAMLVGMDKYDTWFVRNVTASEKNWADNTTITEGRGQEADLITLGPIFDPRGSGWFWEYDVQNYPPGQETDRRASIGTNMRMSRGLLDAMNVVNAEAKKSLHCEAWPTTLVLHSQLPTSHDHSFYPEAGFTHNLPLPFKGVFAPHPVYFRHHWDPEVLHSRINRPDFYKQIHEKVMRDSSFYYDGAHSKEIYVGWKANENVCRAPSLLHPIKRIN